MTPSPSSEQIEKVRALHAGEHIAVFFDLDGTLLDGYSATALYSHRARNFEIGPVEATRILGVAAGGAVAEDEFTSLVEHGLRGWRGRTEDDMLELGERLFTQQIARTLFPEAWRLIKAHQHRGHRVVIATSATPLQAWPLARELGISDVLCTQWETEDGVLTGAVAGRPLWGPGKVAAVRSFAAENGLDLAQSYAYANGDEDVALLNAVGYPRAVNPQPRLAEAAAKHSWPVLRFSAQRTRPNLQRAARTAAMYGSLFASAGTGIVAGALNHDRRRGVDLATSLFGDTAAAFGDITVEISGQENTTQRPAVFLINHQSALIDLLVTTRVLRSGFTAVAKKELERTPLIGRLLSLAGVTFIDRTNSTDAIAALESAVDTLRHGISVVIAPEGTRSPTPQVGPFKKGAFHLAAQAGVPLVPIVIRNAGEIMWRDAWTARSGTVQVRVHPPIPTTGWTSADVEKAIESVRQIYQDTLETWPD